MKNRLFILSSVSLFLCTLLTCEKKINEETVKSLKYPATPEAFIRQYQQWLDSNAFEIAAENATKAEQIRLENLKKFVYKSRETIDSSFLQTTVLSVHCLPKYKQTICVCKMRDQFEVYDITFYLKKINNRWFMDAPQEETPIKQSEELQKIIDSIFQTMENKFQQ